MTNSNKICTTFNDKNPYDDSDNSFCYHLVRHHTVLYTVYKQRHNTNLANIIILLYVSNFYIQIYPI